MSTEHGTGGIQSAAPIVTKEWQPFLGETETHEWPHDSGNTLPFFEQMKGAANVVSLVHRSQNGRGHLTVKYGRLANVHDPDSGYGPDVTLIEELWAIDVIKDIYNAPYFAIALASGHPLYATQDAGTKGLPLSDDQVAFVRYACEHTLTESEITTWAYRVGDGSLQWSLWTTGMKELRYHLLHGNGSYIETGYIFRRTKYCARDAQVQQGFSNINVVDTAPAFSPSMATLVGEFPSGEWLKRAPQAEQYERGKWRLTEEWQWAESWSVVYGGSWNFT